MGETKMTKMTAKRPRTKFTNEQIQVLEKVFQETHYPDSLAQEELADLLGIRSDKVSIWFQNRRSKFKRQLKDDKINWMRNQVYDKENKHQAAFSHQPQSGRLPVLTPSQTNIENRLPVLNLPQIPCFNSIPQTESGNNHVLSSEDKQTSPDYKKPSSNLHYKPSVSTPSTWASTWDTGLRFAHNTSPPTEFTSTFASDILRESNTSPLASSNNYQPDNYFHGFIGHQGMWSGNYPYPQPNQQTQSCMFSRPPYIQTDFGSEQTTL